MWFAPSPSAILGVTPEGHQHMTLTAMQTLGLLWSQASKHDIDWEGSTPVVHREGDDFRIVDIVECDYLPIEGHTPVFILTNGTVEVGTYDEDAGWGTPENDYDAWIPDDQVEPLAELKRASARTDEEA